MLTRSRSRKTRAYPHEQIRRTLYALPVVPTQPHDLADLPADGVHDHFAVFHGIGAPVISLNLPLIFKEKTGQSCQSVKKLGAKIETK